mgnify:CR=1 FL=1
MKRISERLMKRNYPKRLLAVFLAAVFLLAVTAVLIPVTMRRQIAELRAWKEAHEAQERQEKQAETVAPAMSAEGTESDKYDGGKKELKAALRSLTPIGKGVKVAFAALAFLAFLLGILWWVTVSEWLYQVAVLHGLNRALWPMARVCAERVCLPAAVGCPVRSEAAVRAGNRAVLIGG